MGDFSITKKGKPLDKSLYTIDLKNKTFSSKEYFLILDFTALHNWTFKTSRSCIFTTGAHCTFSTDQNCIFNTWNNCTFDTGDGCIFKTGHGCTFNTLNNCIFTTSDGCTFTTGNDCTFKTLEGCTFDTMWSCTFMLQNINTCKFKSYDDMSTILDITNNKHYLLTKELIDMIKVING